MNRIHHIQGWLGKKIWFLVLLPVFFLLHMVTEYYPMLKLKELFIPISGWFILIPVLLYSTIRLLKPSLVKYAGFIFYLELVFFFFGNIKAFFEIYLPVFAHYKYFLTLILAAGIVFFFLAYKRKTPPFRFFLYLNTLLIVLLVIECGQLLVKTVPPVKKAISFNQSKNNLPVPPCDSCTKPDVYFIIFDGYAGSTALKEYWHYNNNELDSFLIDRGFYYASHSTSNYNYTPFSIGSIMNMDYHQSAFKQKIDLLLYCKGIRTIENNLVCRTFQQLGYTIINQSFFPIPGDQPHQSISYLSDKRVLLLTPTLYNKFKADIGWHLNQKATLTSDDERIKNDRSYLRQIKKTYNNLLRLSTQPHNQPVFVYVHFMIPHDPYLFDSTGHVTPEQTWTNNITPEESYLSQLKYANTLIKEIATHLQKPGNRPRVIIIQSDHGFRNYPEYLNHLEFKNLNAIYCPDGKYTGLYDSISSVNTFRFILHKYFNAPLPFLKDSTVYIRHN